MTFYLLAKSIGLELFQFAWKYDHYSSVSVKLKKHTLQGLKPTKRDAYGRLILGDIITSVNGTKVTSGSDLYRILDQCKVGEKVFCSSISITITYQLPHDLLLF